MFATEIQGRVSSSHFPRKLIQTTVHELGHALNLAHRFEREVGRADSTSFMNYDWRYKGGSHTTEFWSRFAFAFDDDELEFPDTPPAGRSFPEGPPSIRSTTGRMETVATVRMCPRCRCRF